jgi:hypothetical protein
MTCAGCFRGGGKIHPKGMQGMKNGGHQGIIVVDETTPEEETPWWP